MAHSIGFSFVSGGVRYRGQRDDKGNAKFEMSLHYPHLTYVPCAYEIYHSAYELHQRNRWAKTK